MLLLGHFSPNSVAKFRSSMLNGHFSRVGRREPRLARGFHLFVPGSRVRNPALRYAAAFANALCMIFAAGLVLPRFAPSFVGLQQALGRPETGHAARAVAVSAEEVPAEADVHAVRDLQRRLEQSGVGDAPPALLQRCCRAAKGDVEKACALARDILSWRKREGVNGILSDPRAIEKELWYRRLLHYWLPGRDRKGRMVMIEAVGQWDMSLLNAAAVDRKGGISGRQNPLSYPLVLKALRDISQINALYYPEAVEHVFVVNTPRLFSSIWSFIAPFVLPSKGVKVTVLRSGDFTALVDECGRSCLPQQLGGDLTDLSAASLN
mmetsp:Transcript_6435/g.16022  ORF Transcript_6435/g.16022 Transcript_6435/m.16022 type:complete len:322 (+) Transcript_6435:3-968(+)